MGRQTKIQKHDWSYIAGFLDGDGSIMVQFKNRRDTVRGWRIMPSVRFYQDTRNEKGLLWIKNKLGIGYLSRRNDGMTELRLDGWERVIGLIVKIRPFIKFKKSRLKIVLEIGRLVRKKTFNDITKQDRTKIADLIWALKEANYKSGWRKFSKTRKQIKKILDIRI